MTKSPKSKVNVSLDPEDTAIISYTGGPTQKPHGVELSHESVYTEALNSALVFEQTNRDVLIQFALPMYHQFGLTSVLMASIHKGNTVVAVPGTGRSTRLPLRSYNEATTALGSWRTPDQPAESNIARTSRCLRRIRGRRSTRRSAVGPSSGRIRRPTSSVST